MPEFHELPAAAQLGAKDEERLIRNLYERKARVYRDTLLALGQKYGEDRKQVQLSPEIRQALREEAEVHAHSTINTYNRFVAAFVEREKAKGATDAEVRRKLPAYMRARAKGRLSAIDQSGTVAARLDAQVAFFRENGIEPLFYFRGPTPKCKTCRALKATSPHPVAVVLEVGIPHLGCVHSWKEQKLTARALKRGGVKPGQITLGRGEPAGIVGSETLTRREGSHGLAADRVYEMARPTIAEEVTDATGNEIALSHESRNHIAVEHPEVTDDDILKTAAHPDQVTPDRQSDRHRIYWHHGGPSGWVRVTVKFVEGDRPWIVSARYQRKGP